MRATAFIVMSGLTLFGCAGDEREEEAGRDTLPKRGETQADPTILSATSQCISGLGTYRAVGVTISASDLRGNPNLGTCERTLAGVSASGEFNQNATCYVEIELQSTECFDGRADFVVDLVVSNESGGFTTASLRVRP